MASKLDSASKSTASNMINGPKASTFGVKSGFVIPKNKLSGSLVPIFRGGGKAEVPGEAGKEENNKKILRKTRWGVDLTQDAAVRRGRSLAYQTRLEQITQQLSSGSLDPDEDRGLESSVKFSSKVDLKLLGLEKREIIGEILRLNPNYKAPPDYEPLLKEANVPISANAHPGRNLIGIILGPENNTQKRLEDETGAKVRVYGTKKTSREKCEISRADVADAQEIYEDLVIHISADTFEKVDAAVALVELLLVTPAFPAVAPVNAPSQVASAPAQSTEVQESQPYAQRLPVQGYPAPWPPQLPHVQQSFQLSISHGYPSQSAPPTRPPQMIPQPGPAFSRPLSSVAQPPPLLRPTNVFNAFPPSPAPAPQRPLLPQLPLQQVNAAFQTGQSSMPNQPPFPRPPPLISVSPSPRPYQPVQAQPAHFPIMRGAPPPAPSSSMAAGVSPGKPHHLSQGDFTFQPHRPPSSSLPMPIPNLTNPQSPFAPQLMQPSFRPATHNPIGGGPSPRLLQPSFPPSAAAPPMHSFGNAGPSAPAPGLLSGTSRAAALIQAHGHHVQSHNIYGSPPRFAAPARPLPLAPRLPGGGDPARTMKREMDPEYEDLMASVGVK